MYYNSKFSNVKSAKFSKNLVKNRDNHKSNSSLLNVRSRVFVNSKCRNHVDNIVKNVCNKVVNDVITKDTDKQQLNKTSGACRVKTNKNRLSGNSSIRAALHDAKKCHLQSHEGYTAIKVCNCPLSWVVNDTFSDPNAGVSKDPIDEATMNDNINCNQKCVVDDEKDNERVSIDYTNTTDILKQVKKGKVMLA